MNAVVELTVEELHFLAAAHGVSAVPGLGPLPTDEAALDLLAGTAARSLVGRGLGIYLGDEFLLASELIPLFDVYEDPDSVVSAERWSEDERGLRTWTTRGDDVVELMQLSGGFYALSALAPDDVPARLADFLELTGDDDGEGALEQIDVPATAVLVDARRVGRRDDFVEGIALEWVDLGDGGRVWVLGSDPERVLATPTGRGRVLAQLAT